MKEYNEIEHLLLRETITDMIKEYHNLNFKGRGNKEELMNNIINFYSEKDWVKKNYEKMNAYEKEITDNYIQQKRMPLAETVDKIEEKYKDKGLTKKLYSYYFINKRMPNCFYHELEEIVPPLKILFTEINTKNYEGITITTNKTSRAGDFDNLLKYINNNKVKPTAKNRMFPKSHLLKFYQNYPYDEYFTTDFDSINDIKTIEDTIVGNSLINLLLSAEVITSKKEYFSLGKNYKEFIKMDTYEKINLLFDKYLVAPISCINEIDRIYNYSFKYSSTYLNLYEPRNFVIDLVKLLPIDKYVDGDKFITAARMKNYNFLSSVGRVFIKDEYYNEYYEDASFVNLGVGFINMVLIENLAVLGIIDVKLREEQEDFCLGGSIYYSVEYLKLTKFGAQILGLTKKDIIPKEANLKFSITDDFLIKIPNCSKKLEYELYFDRFLKSINKDDYETTYLLNFEGIVKLLELGIDLLDVITFIIEESYDVPLNVLNKLYYWLDISDKVIIKEVKILTFPDELKKDVLTKKLISFTDNKIENFIILKKNSQKEVKKVLESNELFCKIE
ncbi:MAG: hypothetical protein RR189_00435 [Bacilli bacterium]